MLGQLKEVFGCGRVRAKGPRSSVLVFAVDSNLQIEAHILPFFERFPPVIKRDDFQRFATIVRSLRRKDHFDRAVFEQLMRTAYSMNHRGRQRNRTVDEIFKGSSETVRQASSPLGDG